MRTHTVQTYLYQLAARTPAPGGGDAAAEAARAAAVRELITR